MCDVDELEWLERLGAVGLPQTPVPQGTVTPPLPGEMLKDLTRVPVELET
jgi:hypothetical protein